MINRRLFDLLLKRLEQSPAVALLGPRQVGKTTLAHAVAGYLARPRAINTTAVNAGPTQSLYLDLETASDRQKLADPRAFLALYEDKLVVLDEVHRAPEIFQELRGVIDEGRRRGLKAGRFLLLGSASTELLRQSESLAGRIDYLELAPLDILETGAGTADRLWARGGFPDSYLAASDDDSFRWRRNFIRTYLHRDVPSFGFSIPAETLERFWTMLAHAQGGLLNASTFASSLGVESKSVARYIDLLCDLLLVRRLQPLHANVKKRLVKSPKMYVRDSGLVHALLGLPALDALLGHPVAGPSWEGFAIENMIACAPEFARVSFYRSAAGAEIDLVLDLSGNERWAIEIKRGSVPRAEKGFNIARADVGAAKSFVVYSGAERFSLGGDVEAISLHEICGLLSGYRR